MKFILLFILLFSLFSCTTNDNNKEQNTLLKQKEEKQVFNNNTHNNPNKQEVLIDKNKTKQEEKNTETLEKESKIVKEKSKLQINTESGNIDNKKDNIIDPEETIVQEKVIDTRKLYIKDKKVYIEYKGITYSSDLIGDTEKISLSDTFPFDNEIYYGNLEVVLPKGKNDIKIIYKCNGPLISDKSIYINIYEYCNTNKKDILTQYEFGIQYPIFTTGGGFPLYWTKIYIKKILGQNIIFVGKLDGVTYDYDKYFNWYKALEIYKILFKYKLIEEINIIDEKNEDEITKKLGPIYLKMRSIIKSNKYLDIIIKNNIEKEKRWEKIFNSFTIEKK